MRRSTTPHTPRSQLFHEDALLEVLNRLTDIRQEDVLVLALLPLFDVCVQANTLALIQVERMREAIFFCVDLSWVLVVPTLAKCCCGPCSFVELFWVILEYPLGQLDVLLDEDSLELLEGLGRLEDLTQTV